MTQPNNSNTKENPVGRFMVAVGGVIELAHTNKILIIQRSQNLDWHPGDWELLYGRLDQFEDPQDALRRESAEEVGLFSLTIKEVVSVWHIIRGTSKIPENDLIGITFRCETIEKTIQLSPEHQNYKWVSPHEALGLISVEGIQKDLEKYIALVER